MLYCKKQVNEKITKQKQRWYFVILAKEFVNNCSYRFTLYGESFILFKDEDKKLVCYRLPLYEETKFSNDACVQPFLALEKQEIIWLWRGESELANENLIPVMNNL